MAILGLPLRKLMSRAARRYHNSGLLLPGTKGKRAAAAVADSTSIRPDDHDDVVPAAPTEISGESIPATETRTDDAGADEPSDSPSPSSVESTGQTDGRSDDESMEDTQGSVEKKAGPSLADILANPLPPVPSVDKLISESLGNIFQKKATKNPAMRSLLDLHGELDMRELAAELKEFAIEIGASKEAE